jgi:transcriptional regulator with XRE-family HTH domain
MSTVGERIKDVRKSLHLTQVELGKEIGVSGSAVSQIEANASKPTEAAIKLICSKYHVNYLWLTEGLGPMMEEEDTDALVERLMAGESEMAISIMKAFVKLPDEEWVKFRDLVDKVKREGLS